jgi:hypothetical protein
MTRKATGVYVEARRRTNLPIESRIIDPPLAIPEGMEMPQRGAVIMPRFTPRFGEDSYVNDLVILVEEAQYPNVQDVIEEFKAHGISWEVSPFTQFNHLRRGSSVIFIHPRAILDHPGDYYAALADSETTFYHRCPRERPEHMDIPHVSSSQHRLMCASLWKEDVRGGRVVPKTERLVVREVGETRYIARKAPTSVVDTATRGMILRYPIDRITVMADDSGEGRDEYHASLAREGGIPVLVNTA